MSAKSDEFEVMSSAVIKALETSQAADARIAMLEKRVQELTGGGSGGDGNNDPSGARVLTPEQYAGMNWEQKHDAIDVMGVDGVKALMRGENVELSDE